MERVQVGYFVRVKVIFSEGSASLRKILLDGARKWLISSFQQHSIWWGFSFTPIRRIVEFAVVLPFRPESGSVVIGLPG